MTSAYLEWSNRENKIYVRNASSTEGVQVQFELPLLEGMNADGSDIRFSDSDGVPLSYWVGDFNELTNIFKIMVKLPANDFYIYFYYGNTNATSESSGERTFEFFDDFEGGATLDLTKWQGGERYSIVNDDGNSALALAGTANNRAWVASKNQLTAPYILEFQGYIETKSNNINFACNIHTSSNTQPIGIATGYLCSDMDNTNGAGFQLYKRDNANWWSLSNPSFTSVAYKLYYVQIIAKSNGIEQSVFTDKGFRLQTGSTTDVLYTSGYIGFNVQNAGVSKITMVTVRKYVATMPELVVVFDLEKLDPESIDITESTTQVYKQLTAKFPTNLVPPEQSRIIYFANTSDATNYLLFYGRVQTLSKTDSHNGISVDMVATDDMKNLADQKVQWIFTKTEVADDPESWVYNMCVNTDVSRGFYSNTPYTLQSFRFEPNTSKWDALQKVMEYHKFILKPYYVLDEANHILPNEALMPLLPSVLDADPDFAPPTPITFTYPYTYLADNPTIEPNNEKYNKVIVHGTYTSAGTETASIAITKNVFEGSERARDFVFTDNYLEEKSDVAEWAAVRLLLYFQTDRATVKFKLMNMVGLELWQRVKFGEGFSNELQRLTTQTQFEYVYACDPNSNTGDLYGNYHAVDTSLVPRPSWLRISSKHFHKDAKTTYTEHEAITDFIVSTIDPEVPAPYSAYVPEGLTKPTVTDTTSVIQKQINNTVSKRAVPVYGTVQASPAPTSTRATVVTDLGITIVVKAVTTLTAGTRVLVVPDYINNCYYVAT